jgi:hypothetical protein
MYQRFSTRRPAFLLAVGAVLLAFIVSGCDMLTSAPAAPSPTPLAPVNSPTPAPPPATLPPTGTPLPPTETPVPPSPTAVPRALTGHVLNAYTGKPISGAHVTASNATSDSGAGGDFDLGVLPPGTMVQAVASGYAPTTVDSGSEASLDLTLRPTFLEGKVTDAATGKPLQGVIVRIDLPSAPAAPPVTATQVVTPNGYLPPMSGLAALAVLTSATATTTSDVTATVPLTNTPPTATATPPPVMPTPFADDHMILAVTDANGNYHMDNVPLNPTLTFKMPGYKLTKVSVGRTSTQDQALDRFVVKALYLTANAAAYPPLYQPILDIADKSEINAIVLNIQDDSAHVVYDTKVQMAVDSGAVDKILPNIKDTIAELHKHNLYVIGRMVTFMQPAVADANPNLAVRSSATGKPWRGGELDQQRWLDPTNPAARQYPLALAREAVSLGFDEIQFDYIRFPSDPAPGEKWDNMSFSQPADDSTKPLYIEQFMREAHNMLNQTDAFMSVDIFGYTVWPDQNGQPLNASIGQVFERMISYTDYICPMIYPSHFSHGELGFADPNSHPYEIIKQAGIYTDDRIAGQRAAYRPWLQAFDWNDLAYDGHMLRLQIQGADDTGASGWQFWDPYNKYEYAAGGFESK